MRHTPFHVQSQLVKTYDNTYKSFEDAIQARIIHQGLNYKEDREVYREIPSTSEAIRIFIIPDSYDFRPWHIFIVREDNELFPYNSALSDLSLTLKGKAYFQFHANTVELFLKYKA